MTEAATPEPQEAPAAKVKVERVRQNGVTRPAEGTLTGKVWEIADQISAEQKRPALRDEVMTAYKAAVPNASEGTVSTQYSRWSTFHGVQEQLKKMRADEKAKAAAEKEAEKAKKKEAAEAKKAAAAKAKEEKAAATAKAKADKAAAAEKAKAVPVPPKEG